MIRTLCLQTSTRGGGLIRIIQTSLSTRDCVCVCTLCSPKVVPINQSINQSMLSSKRCNSQRPNQLKPSSAICLSVKITHSQLPFGADSIHIGGRADSGRGERAQCRALTRSGGHSRGCPREQQNSTAIICRWSGEMDGVLCPAVVCTEINGLLLRGGHDVFLVLRYQRQRVEVGV